MVMKYIPVYETKLVKTGREPYGNISFPPDAINLMKDYYKDKDHEEFCVLYLDAANHMIGMSMITKGILDKTHIHPREIFKGAILANAAHIMLFHNHCSMGPLKPSNEDHEATRRMKEAGEMLGIPVLDHIIISSVNPGYYSFMEDSRL
jgi:DNA repair protein RadC